MIPSLTFSPPTYTGNKLKIKGVWPFVFPAMAFSLWRLPRCFLEWGCDCSHIPIAHPCSNSTNCAPHGESSRFRPLVKVVSEFKQRVLSVQPSLTATQETCNDSGHLIKRFQFLYFGVWSEQRCGTSDTWLDSNNQIWGPAWSTLIKGLWVCVLRPESDDVKGFACFLKCLHFLRYWEIILYFSKMNHLWLI